ncbi:hypothetical protein D1007_17150 [Hordeum vulgare]|nr:hypothetical protein D1007_17150 [Hordeum vulgare]
MEFGVHPMETDMRKMDLMVVYTNDPIMVEDSINTMEQLLGEDDKYKVVGFNLEYTSGRAGHDRKDSITHLCMRHHVLLYHYCLATVPCEHFTRFANSPNYMFATLNTTNDPKVLEDFGLGLLEACRHLRPLQDLE